MFKSILYKKLDKFGWYVVGYKDAKRLGLKHYALPAIHCARGHVAPFLVEKTACVKCIAVSARNKDASMTKQQAFEFWRRKLKLPLIIDPTNVRFIYVVENMPYTRISEAAHMTGLPEGIIYQRCAMDSFSDYHKLPTKYKMGQQFIYYCDGNNYSTAPEACRAEGITSYILFDRINNDVLPEWYKKKIM